MGLLSMAMRNILRKINRTLLVSLALCFAIASIISVYSGIEASSENTKEMIAEYESHIIEMEELSEIQERMIQISTGRGGFGGAHPGGGGGGFGRDSNAVLTQQEASIASATDYVEIVIPKVSKPVGDIDWEEMRKNRESGGHGGGFSSGGSGISREERMNSLFDYFIEGVFLNSSISEKYSLLPSNIVEGRTLKEGDTGMVLIRDDLKGFFDAGLGDFVDIEGFEFQIVGVYSSDINRNTVYMDIDDAQKVTGKGDDDYSSLDVYVDGTDVLDYVVLDLQDQLPEDFQVRSFADQNALFADQRQQAQVREITSLQEANDEVENSGNAIIFISLGSAALIVLFLMMYTVKERTKEIGIFKALGFTENRIMNQFVLEGGIIGLIGGIFGIAIGWAGAPLIAEFFLPPTDVYSTIEPSLFLIAAGLTLSIFLGVVGSIYPAWRASRKSPAEAIRG